LIGIGFCILQYSQANTAASAAAYQPSAALQRALLNAKNAFAESVRIVNGFNTDNQITTPKVDDPVFPPHVETNTDFARLTDLLSKVEHDDHELKQSVVGRFETATKNIEAKLRAYAAAVGSLPPTTPTVTVNVNPTAAAKPVTLPTPAAESLFSSTMNPIDVDRRNATLNSRKEFLKVLGTKAENPENRLSLSEAADQLDVLRRLLPQKENLPASAEPSGGTNDSTGQNELPAQRVAAQLEQLRGEVRQIFLTSWTLDDTLQQASDLAATEREKCRVADLAQKGIWLSAISRILIGLLSALLVSGVILVCADLVKTFLDTASHTGVVADAINAMRGATLISKSHLQEHGNGNGNGGTPTEW
jgi:hypothetical protein